MPSKDLSAKRGPMPGGPQFAPPPRSVDVTTMPRPGDNQPDDRHVTRTLGRDKPFLMDGDHLWVENLESFPVEFKWNRKPYVVGPGEGKAVIFEAVLNKLGDPRSADSIHTKFDDGYGQHGIILERYDELKRLFAYYGVQQERISDFTFLEGPRKGEKILGLTSLVPKLRITTLEGYPVQFPAYDAEMLPFPVNTASSKAVNSDVSRMMDELQAENQHLHDRVSELESRIDRILQATAGTEPT